MPNLMSRCPWCNDEQNKDGAIITEGRRVVRAFKCGSYIYRDHHGDNIDFYVKGCEDV